jgi:hypothetical protein
MCEERARSSLIPHYVPASWISAACWLGTVPTPQVPSWLWPLDAPEEFLEDARRERLVREMSQDTPLMRALGLAHHWQRLMDEGRFASITEIAEAEGFDLGRVSRIARLAQLAPSIVEACATGAAAGVTLKSVSRRAIPQRWDEQRERLRLA